MKDPDFIICGAMKAGTTSLFLNLSKHPDIVMSTKKGPINKKTGGTEMYFWNSGRRRRDPMKDPDFMISGSMKTGTTSLFLNLSKHPDIEMSTKIGPVNEKTGGTGMNYWNKFRSKSMEWYRSRFDGKISGEKSPGYYAVERIVRDIHANCPNVKLIIPCRHPVERTFSQFQMSQRKVSGKRPFSYSKLANSQFVKKSEYYNRLKDGALKVFSEENIHIVITDWMKENPARELMKIHKFLGIEELYLPTKEIEWTKKERGGIYRISKDPHYIKFSKYSKLDIDPKERKKFLEHFKPHNEKLFDFLGYRVPEWEV